MLVITGTGRSGTSFLAKWFQEIGLLQYDANWISSLSAGLEAPQISRVNGAIWVGNDPQYEREEAQKRVIQTANYPVIKDPKFFYGGVLDTWLKYRNDLKFIVLVRDFEAVFKSRLAKGMETQAFHPDAMENIYAHFRYRLDESSTPYEILVFPEFLDEYNKAYSRITKLCPELKIDKDKGRKAWDALVDPSLVHF